MRRKTLVRLAVNPTDDSPDSVAGRHMNSRLESGLRALLIESVTLRATISFQDISSPISPDFPL